MTNDQKIPLADAALRLRVSWHTAYRMLLQGELEGERAGNRWLVSRASIERHEGSPAPAAA